MNIYKFLRILLALFIIGVVIGMVSSAFFGGKEPFLIPYLSTPDEEPVNVQEQEQVSIYEERDERIAMLSGSMKDYIRVFHDNERNVTCWAWSYGTCRGGISCIPDHMLTPP